MDTIRTSRLIGGLLALTGFLGMVILATDQILKSSLGGQHWYGLIVLVIIDFAAAAYVVAKRSSKAFTLVAMWSICRIIIQLANIVTAPLLQMKYGDFANYLFNPALITNPNPRGVPAALIDLILLLELVIAVVALGGRSAIKSTPH